MPKVGWLGYALGGVFAAAGAALGEVLVAESDALRDVLAAVGDALGDVPSGSPSDELSTLLALNVALGNALG